MADALHRRGVLTKLRQSAGQDVDAGCGQLRARDAGGDTARSAARTARSAAANIAPVAWLAAR